MCFKLKRLNLKNNLINDEDNIFFLTSLLDLKYLNLNNNPIQRSNNYKNLILENLSFIEKIDSDEATKLYCPKNNAASLDLEEIFDLTKKDLPKEKRKTENKTKESQTQLKSNINNNDKNNTAKDSKDNFFTVSKSKLAKFNDLKSFSPDTKPEKTESKKENEFLKKSTSNFNLNQIKNNTNIKIVIDASEKAFESSNKDSNIIDIKDKKLSPLKISRQNFNKIEDYKTNNVYLEKHRAPTKEDLINKMEKINKELSQKSQDVTRRLYPVKNLEDFEKTAQKTFGKFKILSNPQNANQIVNNLNSQIPGLLKKTRESKNIMLPKINVSKQLSDNKPESKSNFTKKELLK